MVLRGNLTGMTGYLPGSPDGLYPEDTGVVNILTNPGYRPVNVQKLKKYGQARPPKPLNPKTVGRVEERAQKIVYRYKNRGVVSDSMDKAGVPYKINRKYTKR